MKKAFSQLGRSAAWIIAIIVVSTVVALVVDWRAPWLGLYASDALMRTRGTLPAPGEIAIVAIDEASIARFGRFPWPRTLAAQALDKISAARPKVIGISVLYSDTTTEADDSALAQSIKHAGNVVVAAQLTNAVQGRTEWLRPLPSLAETAAGIGHGNVLTDSDGVARAVLLRESDDEAHAMWSLSAEIVRVADGAPAGDIHEVPGAVRIGSRTVPARTEQSTIFAAAQPDSAQPETYRASRMPLDFIGPTGSFAPRTFSFADVIDGRISPDEFRGRYVLIGATAAAMSDRVASPFTKSESDDGNQHGALMPGVEVLANAVTTMLRERFYTNTPEWMAALIAALIAAAVVFILIMAPGSLQALQPVISITVLLVLMLLAAYAVFASWLIVPPLIPALIAFGTATPLTLLYRAMTMSFHLDDRFAELLNESAKLSPVAMNFSGEPKIARAGRFWPHGTNWKLQLLETLQRQLMTRSQFMDRALRSIEDGLVIADTEGCIVFANPSASRILASTDKPLHGDNLFARLQATDPAIAGQQGQMLSRVLEKRQTMECELVVGESQLRHYTLRIAAVVSGETHAPLGIVATLADITKHRELQQMKNDVMAMVTHEMRTPLTAIKGMSEVLMQFDADAERRREMHQTIHEASERLSRMIDDYLDLSRLESGARQLRLTPVRLASLIEKNLLLMEPLAAQRGINLTRQLSSGLPGIFVDEDLFSRALTNLVANAIKYSPPDSEVTIISHTDGKSVFVSVRDQGPGIPTEFRARIFEKFYRVPRVEDADAPGTGLGLAMVREIAELHGGRVMLESGNGTGSTFTLRLPIGSAQSKHE